MANRMADRTVFTISDVHALLPKFDNTDPDIRFMTLDDFYKVLTSSLPNLLSTEAQLSLKLINNVVELLDDTNGSVRSHALLCITPLASKIPGTQQAALVDRVLEVNPVNSSDTSMVPNALRAIVAGFSSIKHSTRPELNAANAYEILEARLIPRLLDLNPPAPPQRPGRGHQSQQPSSAPVKSGMLVVQPGQDVDPDFLDLTSAFIEAYGSSMSEKTLEKLELSFLSIIKGHSKISNTNRKKAVSCCALLTTLYRESLLCCFLQQVAADLARSKSGPVVTRFMVSLVGAVVRSGSRRISSIALRVIQPVLGLLSEGILQSSLERYAEDDAALSMQHDEVTETSFETLEEIWRSCPTEVRDFGIPSINACLRFSRYNPALLEDDDEEMENGEDHPDDEDDMDMMDDDNDEFDDFEEEVDESEDGTWRVRRNAAKALYTIIKALPQDDDEVKNIVVNVASKALVKALREKEESVLLENIRTLHLLIQLYTKTAGSLSSDATFAAPAALQASPNIRKRRRSSESDGSDEGVTLDTTTQKSSPSPSADSTLELGGSLPSVVTGMNQILASKNMVSCKKLALLLLLDIVRTQSLHEKLSIVLDRIIANFANEDSSLTSTAYSSMSSTLSIKSELLQLLGAIVAVRPLPTSVLPKLAAIVDVVTSSFQDRDAQVQRQAISTSEKIVHAIASGEPGDAESRGYHHISTIVQELSSLLQQSGIDSEVKQVAIVALGVSLTQGSIKEHQIAASFAKSVRSQLLNLLDVESSYAAAAEAFSNICSEAKSQKDLAATDVLHVVSSVSERLSRQDIKMRQAGVKCLHAIMSNKFCVSAIDHELLGKAAQGLVGMIRLNVNAPKDIVLDILSKIVQQWPQVLKMPSVGEGVFSFVDMPLDRKTSDAYVKIFESVHDEEMLEYCASKFWYPVTGHANLSLFGICMATIVQSLSTDNRRNVGAIIANLQKVRDSTFEDGIVDLYALGELARRNKVVKGLSCETLIEWVRPAAPNANPVDGLKYERMRQAAAISIGRAAAGPRETYFEALKSLTSEGIHDAILEACREAVRAELEAARTAARGPGSEAPRVDLASIQIDEANVKVTRKNSQYLRSPPILDGIREFLFTVRTQDEGLLSALLSQSWEMLGEAFWDSDAGSTVVSECLGKVLELAPNAYIPRFKELLSNGSYAARSRCIQGLRCAFRDSDHLLEREIKASLKGILNLVLCDSDPKGGPNSKDDRERQQYLEEIPFTLDNRRHALMTLNTINNASHVLISPHLSEVLPVLLERADINQKYIHEVSMGPFRIKVDDALGIRRVAYETIYSMLNSCASYFDQRELYSRIVAGLGDDNEIQITSNLLIVRMIEINPEETQRRLDEIAEAFTLIHTTKLKENAVKQDVEKLQAVQNEVLKTSVQLQQAFMTGATSRASDEGHAKWKGYWNVLQQMYGQKLHQNGM